MSMRLEESKNRSYLKCEVRAHIRRGFGGGTTHPSHSVVCKTFTRYKSCMSTGCLWRSTDTDSFPPGLVDTVSTIFCNLLKPVQRAARPVLINRYCRYDETPLVSGLSSFVPIY